MVRHMRHKIVAPLSLILIGTALSLPAFGQTGVPHSVENTTNPNAQNATNPDAAVPPSAPGTAVGSNQPAIPASGSSVTAASSGSTLVNAAKDTAITAKIKRALLADAVTSGNDIHVTTDNGVVTLTGEVHVNREASEATRIARTTSGVREVVNQLVVTRNHSGNG
jgi:hyperosmotically inducible periplasmic protein